MVEIAEKRRQCSDFGYCQFLVPMDISRNECLQNPYGKCQNRKTKMRKYQLFRKASFVRFCLFWNCLPASIPSDCDRKRATNSVQQGSFPFLLLLFSVCIMYIKYMPMYISDVRVVLFPFSCSCISFVLHLQEIKLIIFY